MARLARRLQSVIARAMSRVRRAALGVVVALSASGCAARGRAGVALMQPPSTPELPSIELGSAQVLDLPVDPMEGVRVTTDEGAVVARVSPPRGPAEVDRLDPASLRILSHRQESGEGPPAPTVGTLEVPLDGERRLILLWKSGDAEHGFRVMAQAVDARDSAPRGAPVVVSPGGSDVAGPLSAVALDEHHVVVGFAASTADGSFAAFVVPLAVR